MEKCISMKTEPDVRSDDDENASPSLPFQSDSKNLLQSDPRLIKLVVSSTLASSKNAKGKRYDRSCDQKLEETVPDSIQLKNESKHHPEPPSNAEQSEPYCISNPFKHVSDKNCKKSCGLQYGISDVFGQTVLEQQKVKVSKSHISPKIFDDPNDRKYYDHMLEDVMVKNFLSDDEQKIFRKSLEGMRKNYPEILEGQENNMFYCPTSFCFSSRIGENESSAPDALDEMKSSLEVNPNLTRKEAQNLKKIREHLQKLRPELAEQEFVDALACFFYNQRGIFIHSLKLDDHLKVLTNKAREYRRQNKKIGFGLTDFEKKLAEQLNIPRQVLVKTADTVATHLLTKHKASNQFKINGKVIRESIDVQLKGNDRMYVMKLFKPAKDYSIDEVREGVMLGKFESECRVAGENDLCIMLPDSKLILCVEIKRHMKGKDEHTKSANTSNIDKNMMSASQQLRKNSQFISSKHGAILSPDWQFVKICAISPSVYNPEKICSHCEKFILTSDILKTPGGLEKWWKETGLSDREFLFDQESRNEAYKEFQLFFNRVVCMSSVRVVADPFQTWAQVQGNKPHHMSAGHTEASQSLAQNVASGGLDFEDVLKATHHAYKTLFFSKDQMALLTTDDFPTVLFLCDFGAGKSLISKERCIQTAEKERYAEDLGLKFKADPVYFISLVGVNDEGIVDEDEYIFDIYTKAYDFVGIDIKVINAQDLWTFYESKNKGADRWDVDLYFLVEYFIQHHQHGHFVLDECPFLWSKVSYKYKYDATSVKKLIEFLKRCRQLLKNERNLLWISLQSNSLVDLSRAGNDFEKAVKEMKEEMKRNGWILPTLSANMRNQVNIANVQVEQGSEGCKMQSSVEKLKSGTSLIGEVPILYPMTSSDWDEKKGNVLKHCIEWMSQKSDKNIVVLCDWHTFKNVTDDIKRVIKDKKIVVYPSRQSKEEGISNVKQFVEKPDHILVTHYRYFNGCESANVIYLKGNDDCIRNRVLRGVQHILCIHIMRVGHGREAKIHGMKEDNRFLTEYESEGESYY